MTRDPEDPESQKPAEAAPNAPSGPFFVETIPSTQGTISAIASANAPFIYFEAAPFGGQAAGVCAITLVANRLISPGPNNVGSVADTVVVAHLRGNIPAIKNLRNMLDNLILHAETPEDVAN